MASSIHREEFFCVVRGLEMVSYEELIYNFTDVYLKTAMECSICKENYDMTDDTEFLDEYMKLFVSLLAAVENDESLEVSTLKETLEKKKKEKVVEFQTFLKRKTVEAAMESVKKRERESQVVDHDVYIKEIQKFYSGIFDEGSRRVENEPLELLRYMRTKEENL